MAQTSLSVIPIATGVVPESSSVRAINAWRRSSRRAERLKRLNDGLARPKRRPGIPGPTPFRLLLLRPALVLRLRQVRTSDRFHGLAGLGTAEQLARLGGVFLTGRHTFVPFGRLGRSFC